MRKKADFKLVLVIKRPTGKFTLVAAGDIKGDTTTFVTRVGVRLKTGKEIITNDKFTAMHQCQILDIVKSSIYVVEDYGRRVNY